MPTKTPELPHGAAVTPAERRAAIMAIYASPELARRRAIQIVALHIAEHLSSRSGWTFIGQQTIADNVRMRKRDVQQALRSLTGRGDDTDKSPKLDRQYLYAEVVPTSPGSGRSRTFYCLLAADATEPLTGSKARSDGQQGAQTTGGKARSDGQQGAARNPVNRSEQGLTGRGAPLPRGRVTARPTICPPVTFELVGDAPDGRVEFDIAMADDGDAAVDRAALTWLAATLNRIPGVDCGAPRLTGDIPAGDTWLAVPIQYSDWSEIEDVMNDYNNAPSQANQGQPKETPDACIPNAARPGPADQRH